MPKKRNNIVWAAFSMLGMACSMFGIVGGIQHESYAFVPINVPLFCINAWFTYVNVKRYLTSSPG